MMQKGKRTDAQSKFMAAQNNKLTYNEGLADGQTGCEYRNRQK